MLKKIVFVIIIFFIISSCLFLNIAYATNKAIVYLASKQDIVEKEEEIEISVNIENAKTAAFNFSLYFDSSKLEYISNNKEENINIRKDSILMVWFDDKGGENELEGKLITFKFRTKEYGLATFAIEGEFYGANGKLIQTDFREKQIQIGMQENENENEKLMKQELQNSEQKDNVNLQALSLDIEGMIPSFESSVLDYYLTISNEIDELEVLAVGENSNARVEIFGNNNLQEGLNEIKIQVTSEDGSKKNIYVIYVTKTQNLELANANLEILAIENVLLTPPFDVSQTHYKTEISNEQKEINLLAVPEREDAVIEISGKEEIKEGINLLTVIVTAPNGLTRRKYEIEVYRRSLAEEKAYQEEQERRIGSFERGL